MEETWKKDGANLRELLGVGINALEIHGSYPPEEWLQMANESGLMVVVLPRCDGEVFARPEDVDTHIKSIKAQHADIAAHLVGHPSMLFWTTEGTPQLTRRLSRTFHSDPMGRLVTGKEIPAVSLSLQNQSLTQLRAGSWVTEITNLPGSRPETTLSLFERALNTGAIGGVLPVSRNQPEIHRIWTEGVKRLAAKVDLPAYTPKSHRSAMTLRIEGLQPGHIVWAEATGVAPIGAVASSTGEASLRLFHKGSVDLIHNSTSHTVLLDESSRFGTSSQKEAQRLRWP